jgi:glycosyltransferase involved in cell wall biosynthesis
MEPVTKFAVDSSQMSDAQSTSKNISFAVIVPTLNAADDWNAFVSHLRSAVLPQRVMVIDSSSDDGTIDLARRAGFRMESILRSQFNHGSTRQLAAELISDVDIGVLHERENWLKNLEVQWRRSPFCEIGDLVSMVRQQKVHSICICKNGSKVCRLQNGAEREKIELRLETST